MLTVAWNMIQQRMQHFSGFSLAVPTFQQPAGKRAWQRTIDSINLFEPKNCCFFTVSCMLADCCSSGRCCTACTDGDLQFADISARSQFQHAFHPLLLDLTRTHPFKLLFADHGVRRFHRTPFCPLSTKPVIAMVGLVVLAQERGLMKRALDSLSLPCVTYRRKREPSVHRLTGCHDGTGINEDNATRL